MNNEWISTSVFLGSNKELVSKMFSIVSKKSPKYLKYNPAWIVLSNVLSV